MTTSAELQGGTVSFLGIPGTVSSRSLNVDLLENAAREAPGEVEMTIYLEPGLWKMPPFEPGAAASDEVKRLRSAVVACDGIVLATPEYNGSLPGGLKNAIDWIAAPGPGSPDGGPLSGKAAIVIGADRGRFGCDWAVADARKVLEVAGARVLPETLTIPSADRAFAADGVLCEEADRAQLGALMELLAWEARVRRAD